MANDFSLFPIGVRSWKQMAVYKECEFNRQIKRFFYFEDDTKESKKKVILSMLGKIWRDTRGNLFHRFYDDSKSLSVNVQHQCLEGIDKDDWKAFLKYRLEKDTLEKCRKNVENRAKQTYTHVGGSKSLARRTEEEVLSTLSAPPGEQKKRRQGMVGTSVEERSGLLYIGERMGPTFMMMHSHWCFWKEHSGRVRGVGLGPYPTKLFDNTSQQSSYGRQIEEYQKEIIELKAEAVKQKKKSQRIVNLLRFLLKQQGENLPPEIVSEMNALGGEPADSHTRPSFDNPNQLSPK
ncbi:hypothetical protein PIB30_050453 [Stylosanthes scabra]|uniref:Transposase, Ptta/En/Spm, plant n=1 Tax=Stylosanthes scabra TaxID=79078 RepID=A0ABU6UH16_9FABA|nr:hypothetical protein [Stylosanthes scabra]